MHSTSAITAFKLISISRRGFSVYGNRRFCRALSLSLSLSVRNTTKIIIEKRLIPHTSKSILWGMFTCITLIHPGRKSVIILVTKLDPFSNFLYWRRGTSVQVLVKERGAMFSKTATDVSFSIFLILFLIHSASTQCQGGRSVGPVPSVTDDR